MVCWKKTINTNLSIWSLKRFEEKKKLFKYTIAKRKGTTPYRYWSTKHYTELIKKHEHLVKTNWFSLGFVIYKKRCTRLTAANDKAYKLLAHGWWFSPGTPASSTTKTGRHDIVEILLKVALNTKNESFNQS